MFIVNFFFLFFVVLLNFLFLFFFDLEIDLL